MKLKIVKDGEVVEDKETTLELAKKIISYYTDDKESKEISIKIFSNENLGMNTLVHGNIMVDGKKGMKLTGKLKGWCDYKMNDEIKVSFDRMHFFDKETTNAIREGK